jgi:heavy metal translocating P-type ATPase
MSANSHHETYEGPWWRYPLLRNALLAAVVAVAGFALAHVGVITEFVERLFYFTAIPIGGYHWAREAIENFFREHTVGIDILMLAATFGSGVLGLWDEAAALVVLYGAAEGLEEYTYARTRSAIRALLDLAPKEAHVLRGSKEVTVPAAQLEPGDRFLVRPGESVPTDGIIRAGTSSVDESPITGESIPVDKGPGMKVFAATLNHQGALEVEATATFADNTLSKIIHLVETAQEQKGRAQQWIERFGERYSPVVLLASLLFIIVPWLLGLPIAVWAERGVVLLVAAAPCALVMSTPVAMAAGITTAGRRGILIKGGAHLEHLGNVRAIAFDKTGTLTYGRPAVVDVIPLVGTADDLLSLAAGVEHWSEHPLARAIVNHAETRAVAPMRTEQFQALTGAGARALAGTTWYVGSPALFESLGLSLDTIAEEIGRLEAQGKTVVLTGNQHEIRGLIALQDSVRPEAAPLIAALQAAGIQTAMLTGDNERTARAVAVACGIDEVHAGLAPAEKVRVVHTLVSRHGTVLMIGDGVNDAPALAAATCGIAMGVAGTDAAIEAADVALMADDLSKLQEAIALARRAHRISSQNIAFSLVLLAVLIPAAVLGVITVAVAVIAHEASELLAVANGLRAGHQNSQMVG